MRKVLFMLDDCAATLRMNKALLSGSYAVHTFTEWKDMAGALERVKPDAILLDVFMLGTGGREAAKRIKADGRFGGIPIVFLSIYDNESGRLDLSGIDYDGYVTKPLDVYKAGQISRIIEKGVKEKMRQEHPEWIEGVAEEAEEAGAAESFAEQLMKRKRGENEQTESGIADQRPV